jgi:hypothetical protein
MPRPRTATGGDAEGPTVAGTDAVDATGVCDEIREGVAAGSGVAGETGEGVSDVAAVEDWPGAGAVAPGTLP